MYDILLGVDSPFFSAIVLFKKPIAIFPRVFGGFLERNRIPGFRLEMDKLPLEYSRNMVLFGFHPLPMALPPRGAKKREKKKSTLEN